MVNLLTQVLNGVEMFVWTIWGLQERRFLSAFNLASSVVLSMITSLVLLTSMNDHRGPGVYSSPLLYVQS